MKNESSRLSGQPEAISEYLSGKIRFIGALAMVFVVFIHAYNYTDSFLQPRTCITEGLHAGAMLQFFLSNALTRSAVPLYFIISGYLFFAKRELTAKVYARQIGKRLRSLLLVFLIFSAVSFACCLLIYRCTGPGMFPLIDERMAVAEQGLFGAVKIFLNNPFAFQLWFLIQLFYICLLSPLIYVLILRFGILVPALLAVPWLLDMGVGIFSFHIFSADTYLFFTVGAYLAIKKVKLPGMDGPTGSRAAGIILPGALVLLSAGYTLLCATAQQSGFHQQLLYKLIGLVGVAAVWFAYDLLPVPSAASGPRRLLEEHSIMVFLLHEPLMHMLYNLGLRLTQANWMHMLLYFGLPLLMILLLCAVGALLKKHCLPLHRLLTGGR